MKHILLTFFLTILFISYSKAQQINANPDNYDSLVSTLTPGDTLRLAPGNYTRGLKIFNIMGTSTQAIVIMGSGDATVFTGNACCNTVSIKTSAYVTISNFKIDGQNIANIDGVKAEGNQGNWAHHIELNNLLIVGHGGTRATVGISTKCPAWDWVIRECTIDAAGTGMYLGDSDGKKPFVNGIVEYNLVKNTMGYNIQIKHQNVGSRNISGMTLNGKTIIRHNVFSKESNPSSGYDSRPNLLVGGFPASGDGSNDYYEIYGNFLWQNPSESLFQGTGNIMFYDNVCVNYSGGWGLAFQPHNGVQPGDIKIFHNTIISDSSWGIKLQNTDPAFQKYVYGNAVFSDYSSPIHIVDNTNTIDQSDNIEDGISNADNYVNNATNNINTIDLYPITGSPLNASLIPNSSFTPYVDYSKDFNADFRNWSYRGAYAGEGINNGWDLAIEKKNLSPPPPVQCDCPDIPETGNVVTVQNVTELRNALDQANAQNGNMTIKLQPGVYQLTSNLRFINEDMTDLTIMGATGNREDVIIKGLGWNNSNVTHIFSVAADRFTVADMTIGEVWYHPIQVKSELDADDFTAVNVRFVDAKEQLLKVSGGGSGSSFFSDNGRVICCEFEFTAGIAYQYYTGGIDAHKSKNWLVQNNTFKGIRSPDSGLAEHAIHFWQESEGTIVTGNQISNCDRGIGFGLGSDLEDGHIGGLIMNNFVHTNRDVGIGLEHSPNTKVYNNTVITDNYSRSIEYRFPASTNVEITNNLVSEAIALRSGAPPATTFTNHTISDFTVFADAANYDYHLNETHADIVDVGTTLNEINVDIDCENRDLTDIGADEYYLELLPTGLMDFTSDEIHCEVRLEWRTATEQNTDYFEIQKSTDGINFIIIERVRAFGNSSIPVNYYHIDESPLMENYYRLKAVDLDGSYEYFDIIHVKSSCYEDNIVEIYPNPIRATQALNIRLHAEASAKTIIEMVNIFGQVVRQTEEYLHKGINTISYPTDDLPPGNYFIRFRGESWLPKAQKLMKVD